MPLQGYTDSYTDVISSPQCCCGYAVCLCIYMVRVCVYDLRILDIIGE